MTISTLTPFTQAKISSYTGPPKSGKSWHLIGLLTSAEKSGLSESREILVTKHPYDDEHSKGKISSSGKTNSIDALVFESPEQIAKRVNSKTKHVFVSGANFYEDESIVVLFKELLDSGRNIYFSGINLTYDGKPFNHIGKLMALADFHNLCKANCGVCDAPANRSVQVQRDGKFHADPRCLTHWDSNNRPDHKYYLVGQQGALFIKAGSMYSSKTESAIEEFSGLKKRKGSYKWRGDQRYGEKRGIKTNNLRVLEAKEVENADDLMKDVLENKYHSIFIDEIPFFKGIDEVVEKLILYGVQVHATSLLRTFTRLPFPKVPELLCLADRVDNMHYGICNNLEFSGKKTCFHPAVETQRFVEKDGIKKPASCNDPIILVGAKNYYETSCRDCHRVLDEPKKTFDLPDLIKDVYYGD